MYLSVCYLGCSNCDTMDKLNAAIEAHLLGATIMAHHVRVELLPIICNFPIIDKDTELKEFDVVKIPVKTTKILAVNGKPQKVSIIDHKHLPPNFPKRSGGWPSGCLWKINDSMIIEMSYQSAGNTVCHRLKSLDVWAVLGPKMPTGQKNVSTHLPHSPTDSTTEGEVGSWGR